MALLSKKQLTVLILQIILVNCQIFDKQNLLRGADEERVREIDGVAIEEDRNNDERNTDEKNTEDNTKLDRDSNITDTDDYYETTTYIYRTTDRDGNEQYKTKYDFANIGSEVEIVDEDIDAKENTTNTQDFDATDKPTADNLTALEDEEDQVQEKIEREKGSQVDEDKTEEVRQGDESRTTAAYETERANTPAGVNPVMVSIEDEVSAAPVSYLENKANRPSFPSPSSSSLANMVPRSTTEPSEYNLSTMKVREIDPAEQRSLKSNTDQRPPQRHEFKPLPTPTAATKSLTLKNWLEDRWLRPPPGILVPLRPSALRRALSVWNDLTDEGLKQDDIVLIGYDSNGVNWRSHHNLLHSGNNPGNSHKTVGEMLSKLLVKYQGLTPSPMGDATMKSLASSAKMVPYDSALFLITDRGPADMHKLPLALRALVEKRLKVFTIWTDPGYPSAESARQLMSLVNVSQHTEGDVLPYSLRNVNRENANMVSVSEQWDAVPVPRQGRGFDEDKGDILMIRRGGGEAISLGVPVEGGVTALRVYIEGLVEHAVLYPPYDGPQIDLYNSTSVQLFSPQSRTDGLSPRDVCLVFPTDGAASDDLNVLPASPKATQSPSESPTVGQWHLSVRCDTCDYRLCLTARSLIHASAKLHDTDLLRVRVVGPVASVRESLLVDEYGNELAKLPFSYEPTGGDGHELLDSPTELTEEMTLPKVKGGKVYVKIVGRDVHGSPFVRLSGPITSEARVTRSASFPDFGTSNEVERAEFVSSSRLRYNQSGVLPFSAVAAQALNQQGSLLTTVQIGLSSRLYGAPGDTFQLHFEVTNYRAERSNLIFGAKSDLGFLRSVVPTTQSVLPGQTVNVIVNIIIPSSAQPGARDTVTFTVYELSREVVSISAYIYVQSSGLELNDVTPPEMWHSFQGSCIGRQGSDCAQYTWSVTVTARDTNSGLLRISSTPVGLTYTSQFAAGTREPVTASYRATCCAPRIVATAVDANGNLNSYVLDVSSYINEAGIAAIVLGVFLLIAIICLLVFLIYWCVKRRRESRELPSYTTSRNIS